MRCRDDLVGVILLLRSSIVKKVEGHFLAGTHPFRWGPSQIDGDFIRRLLENYCFVLLTNRAPPQISDNRPDMRHRAYVKKGNIEKKDCPCRNIFLHKNSESATFTRMYHSRTTSISLITAWCIPQVPWKQRFTQLRRSPLIWGVVMSALRVNHHP